MPSDCRTRNGSSAFAVATRDRPSEPALVQAATWAVLGWLPVGSVPDANTGLGVRSNNMSIASKGTTTDGGFLRRVSDAPSNVDCISDPPCLRPGELNASGAFWRQGSSALAA